MDSSDPEELEDQLSNLSSPKETVLFLGFLFLQTDLFLNCVFWMILFSAEAIFASSTSKSGIQILLQNTKILDHPSSIRLGLNFVLVDLSSDLSENLLFLSFKENPDSLVFHVATGFLFLRRTRFVYGSHRTCVCAKKD